MKNTPSKFFHIAPKEGCNIVARLLILTQAKIEAQGGQLYRLAFPFQSVFLVQSSYFFTVDYLEGVISREGHRVEGIHGDKSQLKRDTVRTKGFHNTPLS